MDQNRRQLLIALGLGGTAMLIPGMARAEKNYDVGATDTEIKIGNTGPYSGPGSSYSTIWKCEAAFFKMINGQGGINGRKINFLSYDDAYSPPKTVEQVRKLVESDQVLFLFNTAGTPTNTAIHKYMNQKKVPHLLLATGATKWGDPEHFPWTIGFQPTYQSETRIYASYILEKHPNAKIGILYQNDDYGKDYVKGLKDGLGTKAQSMIVMETTYETTDPTVDSQIVNLKSSGADVFLNVTIAKYAAQAIRKAGEIGWKPVHFLNNVATTISGAMKPAGFENCQGILSTFWIKDPTDPTWKDDAGYKEWVAYMDKYYPEGDKTDNVNAYAYTVAQTLMQVLKQCGDDLTRDNLMKQVRNIHDLELPMLLPGIKVNTGPNDPYPIKQMQMARFDGERWALFGPVMTGNVHV
jgi:branched-chain amino acid transport system substrate-binding protein